MRTLSILLTAVSLLAVSTATADDTPTLADVQPHIQAQQWDKALPLLKQVVENEPDNGQAMFFLAYATHAGGDIKAALKLHKKAATFDAFRPIATYNIACAHALLKQEDQAIAALNDAIAAGFGNLEQVEGDSDFDSLRDNPKFKAIVAGLRKASEPVGDLIDLASLPAERQFDFYAGSWTVHANGGETVVTAEQILNNRVLQINGPTFASLITYVPTLKTWKWTWVSNAGHHDVLEGGLDSHGQLVLVQKVLRDRPNMIGRTIFSKISPGSFEMDWAVSADEGKTWRREYHARYVRNSSSSGSGAAAAKAGL